MKFLVVFLVLVVSAMPSVAQTTTLPERLPRERPSIPTPPVTQPHRVIVTPEPPPLDPSLSK